MFDKGIAFVEV